MSVLTSAKIQKWLSLLLNGKTSSAIPICQQTMDVDMLSLMFSIKHPKLPYYPFKMSQILLRAQSTMRGIIIATPSTQETTTKGGFSQQTKKHASHSIVLIALILRVNVNGIHYLVCVTNQQDHSNLKIQRKRDGGNGMVTVKTNLAFASPIKKV